MVLISVSAAQAQSVLYVDDSATGTNDGTSWCDAYAHLQDGLAGAAASSGAVTEIRVAQGTYKPDRGAGQTLGDREATFHLLSGVAIKGGYAGCGEPDPDARDLDLFETVLSGDLNGDDGPDFQNNTENSDHIVTGTGAPLSTVLDGLTISGGNATWCYCGAGGLQNDGGDLVLVNCTFRGNRGSTGGGIHNANGDLRATNSTFIGNVGDESGAVYSALGSLTFVGCLFSGNKGWDTGGGISGYSYSVTLTNCTFVGNWGWPGGAIAAPSATLSNCILWDNHGPTELDQISGPAVVDYSDVQGGWPGTGNIDSDPLFVSPGHWDDHGTPGDPIDDTFVFSGDYTLRPGSPCIDAGNNIAVPPDTLDLDNDGDTDEPIPFDLDGDPRFVDDPNTADTGNGTAPIVDMGAYEFQGDNPIPAVSAWALAVLAMLMLFAGAVKLSQRSDERDPEGTRS
jgi:hypothetical protein